MWQTTQSTATFIPSGLKAVAFGQGKGIFNGNLELHLERSYACLPHYIPPSPTRPFNSSHPQGRGLAHWSLSADTQLCKWQGIIDKDSCGRVDHNTTFKLFSRRLTSLEQTKKISLQPTLTFPLLPPAMRVSVPLKSIALSAAP